MEGVDEVLAELGGVRGFWEGLQDCKDRGDGGGEGGGAVGALLGEGEEELEGFRERHCRAWDGCAGLGERRAGLGVPGQALIGLLA